MINVLMLYINKSSIVINNHIYCCQSIYREKLENHRRSENHCSEGNGKNGKKKLSERGNIGSYIYPFCKEFGENEKIKK